jgi:hypothetical protein
MPKTTPPLNQIVNALNSVYEYCPNTWNWVIALTILYVLGQNDILN